MFKFYLSIAGLFLLVVMFGFRNRATLGPRMRSLFFSGAGHNYTPLSTFADQASAGLSSNAFDLEANLTGDSRAGLDERGAREIEGIMKEQRVNFDQARLIRHNRYLAENGIDPSGMPIDAKAVTRL